MAQQVENNGRRDEDERSATVFRLAVSLILQILAEIARFYHDGC